MLWPALSTAKPQIISGSGARCIVSVSCYLLTKRQKVVQKWKVVLTHLDKVHIFNVQWNCKGYNKSHISTWCFVKLDLSCASIQLHLCHFIHSYLGLSPKLMTKYHRSWIVHEFSIKLALCATFLKASKAGQYLVKTSLNQFSYCSRTKCMS